MSVLDWIVLSAYGVILVGLLFSARRTRTLEDFAVASREIPGPIIFATLAATFVGPGYSIGLVGKAASQGYIWLFIFSAFCAQTFLVGRFIAPKIQQLRGVRTIGGIMGLRYGRLTQFITGLLTLALLTGFVGVMVRASAELVSGLTGFPLPAVAVVSTVLVLAYSTFGGIKADIINDVFHFVLLSVGIPLVLIFMVGHHGLEPIREKFTSGTILSNPLPLSALTGAVLGFFFGEALIPPYVVRALASRAPSEAKWGFTLAAGFGLAWFTVCTTIGWVVSVTSTPEASGENPLVFAMQEYLPVGLVGLVLVGLIGIILSSWDSLLNCASTSFHSDIASLLFPRLAAGDKALLTSRLMNLVLGIGAAFFALGVDGIIEALLYCYTLWAPTVILPLVLGVLKRDVCPYSGLSAIAAGGIATGLWEWAFKSPLGIPSILVGLVANIAVFWLVHLLFRGAAPVRLFTPLKEKVSG